jgi:hypothetical protein
MPDPRWVLHLQRRECTRSINSTSTRSSTHAGWSTALSMILRSRVNRRPRGRRPGGIPGVFGIVI